MEEGVYWIDPEKWAFEKEISETMQALFWDEFMYGTSMTKVEKGKLIRIPPFSDEYNAIINNKKLNNIQISCGGNL